MTKYLTMVVVALAGCLLLVPFPVEASTARAEDYWANGIWIFSPTNTTYTTNNLPLNITAKRSFSPEYYNTQLKYNIDDGENISIPIITTFVDRSIPDTMFSYLASYKLFSGTIALPELPQGAYNLTVFGEYNRAEGVDPKYPNMYDIQTIRFAINNGVPPKITMSNFDSVIFENDSLPLNFVIEEPVVWMGYSFDGKENVTVSGNFTLSDLAYGAHNVTVYAKDLLGNEGASTADFTVEKKAQIELEIVVLFAIVVAVCIGSIVLFRRHRFKARSKAGSMRYLFCGKL